MQSAGNFMTKGRVVGMKTMNLGERWIKLPCLIIYITQRH